MSTPGDFQRASSSSHRRRWYGSLTPRSYTQEAAGNRRLRQRSGRPGRPGVGSGVQHVSEISNPAPLNRAGGERYVNSWDAYSCEFHLPSKADHTAGFSRLSH